MVRMVKTGTELQTQSTTGTARSLSFIPMALLSLQLTSPDLLAFKDLQVLTAHKVRREYPGIPQRMIRLLTLIHSPIYSRLTGVMLLTSAVSQMAILAHKVRWGLRVLPVQQALKGHQDLLDLKDLL